MKFAALWPSAAVPAPRAGTSHALKHYQSLFGFVRVLAHAPQAWIEYRVGWGVMIKRSLCGLLTAFALSAPASAAVINIGFEQGLTGWTASGNVVVDSTGAFSGTFSALLTAEVPHTGTPSSLSQVFNLNSGETITFYAQFTGLESNNKKGLDTANVSIGVPGQYTNILASWVVPANSGTGPWLPIVFTAPSAGSFEFRAQVDNVANSDSNALSTLRVDSVAPIASAVPEPSTWAMMIIGFAAVGFVAYRRSRKAFAV